MAHYQTALGAFEDAHKADIDQLSDSEKLLVGPLELYDQRLTIVLDGWDELGEETRPSVEALIHELIEIPDVSLIVTSRRGVAYPSGAHEIEIPRMTSEIATCDLSAVEIPSDRHETLITIAGENWLLLSLAAYFSMRSPDAVPTDLTALYRTMIDAATERHGWEVVGPILTTFAATVGPGPVLPYALFAHAVRSLGGPYSRSAVETVLADKDLHAMIERSSPSSLRRSHRGLSLDPDPGTWPTPRHRRRRRPRRLLDAIDAIAPPEPGPEARGRGRDRGPVAGGGVCVLA